MYIFIIIIILVYCIFYFIDKIEEIYVNKAMDLNFWKSKYENHHDKIYKFIEEIKYYLEKHKINYWVHAGTLLGYLRHNGIIPWDDDVDFGYIKNDNIDDFMNDLKKNNYPITDCLFGSKIHSLDDKKVFIDLFEFQLSEGKFKQTARSEKVWPNENYLYDELLPLKECNFGGIKLFCPNKPESFCTRVYSKNYLDIFRVETPHSDMFLNNLFDGIGIFLIGGKKFLIKDLKNHM